MRNAPLTCPADPKVCCKKSVDALALRHLIDVGISFPEEGAVVEDARPHVVDIEIGFCFGRHTLTHLLGKDPVDRPRHRQKTQQGQALADRRTCAARL